jgi:hypothetical protein
MRLQRLPRYGGICATFLVHYIIYPNSYITLTIKNMGTNQILHKTLSEMNYVFSSNEFSKLARNYGISNHLVHSGVLSSFLHRNAKQMESRRMWTKLNGQKDYKQESTDKISDAISLLKQNGYKIMKPINDWIEL